MRTTVPGSAMARVTQPKSACFQPPSQSTWQAPAEGRDEDLSQAHSTQSIQADAGSAERRSIEDTVVSRPTAPHLTEGAIVRAGTTAVRIVRSRPRSTAGFPEKHLQEWLRAHRPIEFLELSEGPRQDCCRRD